MLSESLSPVLVCLRPHAADPHRDLLCTPCGGQASIDNVASGATDDAMTFMLLAWLVNLAGAHDLSDS